MVSRGCQHIPEKYLAEYGWTVVDWVTTAQYKKPLKPICKWALVRWWTPPHFSGCSGYSAHWQFMSMKVYFSQKDRYVWQPCLISTSFPTWRVYSSQVWDGFLHCNEKCGNHNSGKSVHLSWHLFVFISQTYTEQRCIVLQDFCTLALY